MRKLVVIAAVSAVTLMIAPSASAAVDSVFGGDVACTTESDGTQFCGGEMSTAKTFDGVPIDVNVAIPKGQTKARPLVMLFHGYGGSKLDLDDMQRWVDRGYVAFSMSDRGFGDSCGSMDSRLADPVGCADGWVHLMDTRFEVRDAQLFAGKLVDEGLVEPRRIGAIGGSYGGGLSLALAALGDRTMKPNGKLIPWKSPGGERLQLAGAAPNIPWSDLAYSLMPNGGTLDYLADSRYRGRIGVVKQSFVAGLYFSGLAADGFYAPPGADPDADLTSWYTRINAGEPYDGDPDAEQILQEIKTHHSSYYIDHSQPPAPVLLTNGWTDDLFPIDEGVRFYNRTRQQYPNNPVSLYFADQGHQRGQNKEADVERIQRAQERWLDFYVLDEGTKPRFSATALTQTCGDQPSAGPFRAKSWAKLSRGEVRLRSRKRKVIAATVVDPAAAAFDPIGGGGACATAPGENVEGAASYSLRRAPKGGYTLLGSPTVIAKIASPTANSQLAGRLVDVAPSGEKTLVARGLLRPKVGVKARKQVFQLHGNGWKFDAGHVPKLELLPEDSPYARRSNGQGEITVSNLRLRLPVRDRPDKGGVVRKRKKPYVPQGGKLSRDFKRLFQRGR